MERITRTWSTYLIRLFQNWCVGESFSQSTDSSSSIFLASKISSQIDSQGSILWFSSNWTNANDICIEMNEEDRSGGEEELDQYGIIERHEVFARYHDSIVGHLGVERTLKAMSLGGHSWAWMCQNVANWKVGLASVGYARRSSIKVY